MESRSSKGTVEVRANADGKPVIVGYAAVFNRDSADMGFIEQVDPRAFDKTIGEADVRGLGNHDVNWLLGRSKAQTLRLGVDSIGLRYEIDVNEADPDGVRAVEKVRRGDWDGSSFSFKAIRDEWNWDANPPQRRLLEVGLIDVGPVTFPAYPDATAAARALEPIAKRSGRKVEELVEALRTGEIRSLLEPAPTEERIGKKLSTASKDLIKAAMKALRDLLDQAKEEAPGDAELLEGNSLRSALAAIGAKLEGRADIPSLEALIEMYQCGEDFILSESGPDDEQDRQAMYALLASIDSLIVVEAAEPSGDPAADEAEEDDDERSIAPVPDRGFTPAMMLELRERELSVLQSLAA